MRVLKILPKMDDPTKHNYNVNYGVWDVIDGDTVCLESFNADLNEYDVVFLPMFKRWRGHADLLDRIKSHRIKTVLFDNDTCYRSFGHEFYTGIDYIFYRCLDVNGQCPDNGSLLPWSVNADLFAPVYGGRGVSFLCSVSRDYPLRQKIANVLPHPYLLHDKYIAALQASGGSIHTNNDISTVVRGKVLEIAACGTQVISNRCDNMDDYFPDDLIIYFDDVDHLLRIVNSFQPDITTQKKLREIVEDKHTHVKRAKQILEKI